jgi:hypothetical protein
MGKAPTPRGAGASDFDHRVQSGDRRTDEHFTKNPNSANTQDLMRRAALAYGERFRLPVFPIWGVGPHGGCACPRGAACGGRAAKHPRVAHGLLEATDNPIRLSVWWNKWQDANIGIRCTEFFVVDSDPRHGGDETLAMLEAKNGALPKTWKSLTGGGGEHYCFQPVSGLGNSTGDLGPGLDIRGSDGYIVVPPSRHVSGRPYAWDVDSHPLHTPLAAAPPWLLERLRPKTRGPIPAEEQLRRFTEPVKEGGRHARLTQLVGHLLRHGVDPAVAREMMTVWNAQRCRPRLDLDELAEIIDDICKADLRGERAHAK